MSNVRLLVDLEATGEGEAVTAALEYRNGVALCPKCRKHLYSAAGCPCGWRAKSDGDERLAPHPVNDPCSGHPRQLFPPGCECPSYGHGLTMTRVNATYCPVHRPRPDFDPRIDYPERYTDGRPV